MEPTILIADAPGTGYAYLVRLPRKHMPFVDAFKEQVPEKGRDWHPRLSAWLFRRAYLDAVRQVAAQFAEAEGWHVLDTTVLSKEQATQELAELDRQELEAHVTAVLDILPKIPANYLELAAWLPEVLVVDLNEYLGEELFRALIAAGYPDRKHTSLPYISTRSSKTVRVIFANDIHIVTALLSYKIQYLTLQSDLTLVTTFDDGVAHWHDQNGKLWFGAPYMQAIEQQEHACEIIRPHETYRTVLHDGQIYLVATAESYIQQISGSNGGIYSSHISEHKYSREITLFASIRRWHLEQWFKDWAHQVIASETCTPYSTPYFHHWYWENASYWVHPGQSLIHTLLSYHEEETQEMLGWSDVYLQSQHERIKQLKTQHAQQYLQYCREHATELAASELRSKKGKGELLQLGEQYDIPLRKSWTNQRMIEVLLGAGQKSEQLAYEILEIPNQVEEQQAIHS